MGPSWSLNGSFKHHFMHINMYKPVQSQVELFWIYQILQMALCGEPKWIQLVRKSLKATPGCLRGSSAPWITRLFDCHKQLWWTIITPWSYIVMVLSVCRYVADEPPLPYSSNWLHHLYRSQILICSSVRFGT